MQHAKVQSRDPLSRLRGFRPKAAASALSLKIVLVAHGQKGNFRASATTIATLPHATNIVLHCSWLHRSDGSESPVLRGRRKCFTSSGMVGLTFLTFGFSWTVTHGALDWCWSWWNMEVVRKNPPTRGRTGLPDFQSLFFKIRIADIGPTTNDGWQDDGRSRKVKHGRRAWLYLGRSGGCVGCEKVLIATALFLP